MTTTTTTPATELPPPSRAPAARCPHLASPDAAPAPRRAWSDLPGPRIRWWGLPLLAALQRDYLGFVEALRRDHGDLVAMRIGRDRMVDVFDPDDVREVLVTHADRVIRWERGIAVFAQAFGRSVLVTEGDVWRRQRRMLMPAFTPRRVADRGADIVDTVATALRALDAPCDAGRDVDLEAFFSTVTVRVIGRTLFGPGADADADAVARATQVLSRTAMREMFRPMTLPDWLPLPGKAAKRAALRTLRGLVGRQVDARYARVEGVEGVAPGADDAPRDLLGTLLALRDTEGPGATGGPLSRQEVLDQCIVTFQAGHETTATTLCWWARLLAEHPRARERVQAEVDEVLAGRAPAADDAARLPWLIATLKEALRLYPPAAALMTRRATEDFVLRDTLIPRGTMIRLTPWAIQRDPRHWPEPTAFRPERFLPDAPAPGRGAWLPFGTGPRVCIGQHFAMTELLLVGALLAQRMDWSLAPGAAPSRPEMNVTLRDAGGLRVRLRRRAGPVAPLSFTDPQAEGRPART